MAKIGGAAPKATLSAAEIDAGPAFQGPDTRTGEASASSEAVVPEAAADGSSDAKKGKALTQAIKDVGKKTREKKTRERLIKGFEGRGVKRRSRRKRRAVVRAIDEAGDELRDKVKVRLAKPGKTVRVKTGTGQQVEGGLAQGERSRVLTAADGSKVFLVNRRLKPRRIKAEVTIFITETFVRSGQRNGLEITQDVLNALLDVIVETYEELSSLGVLQDVVNHAGDTTPEDRRVIARNQVAGLGAERAQVATFVDTSRISA